MHSKTSRVKFDKVWIDALNRCESCGVFDVDGDGVADIVCGTHWYQGPDFKKKFPIMELPEVKGYVPSFSDFGMDVNGDGRMDVVSCFWFTEQLTWRENPGVPGETWKEHVLATPGCVETTRFFDIDGCGTPEIFPNTPQSRPVYYKLIKDEQGRGTGQFKEYVMADIASDHGMGFGDINGNGKTDVILRNGWLEQPDDLECGAWIFHDEFALPHRASIPMLVHDVNGDGLNDIIAGFAHNYGLVWYEQKLTNGVREWIRHDIDMSCSQYHDMRLCDIDGDGELELVTGKRVYAHNGADPGADDPMGVYYFKIRGGDFEKYVIDYGGSMKEGGQNGGAGLGIYFEIADLTGNGYPDIIAPGKDGLAIFYNHGPNES